MQSAPSFSSFPLPTSLDGYLPKYHRYHYTTPTPTTFTAVTITSTSISIILIFIIITMVFVPDPAAVQDYVNRYWRYALRLGSLPTDLHQRIIERALGRLPAVSGNVKIYWPALELTHSSQKHGGWCHVLCTTEELRNILMRTLDGHRIRSRSKPFKTKRPMFPIVCILIRNSGGRTQHVANIR